MESIVRTNKIEKSFHGVNVLKQVSITLEAGKIYGLIGQNGAGKTTMMRVIMGLSYPNSGSVELFGKQERSSIQKQRRRIGCMIERPSISGNLSALENIRYHRLLQGLPNKEQEGELLKLVGLSDTGKKRVKHFSFGMKQRLGIAIALLGNPEFLILDEPINGLDPIGVVEIRTLLKRLNEERQMTILISSHNLPELYQTATDYIMLHHGEVKECLTQEELEMRCRKCIKIRCNEVEELVRVLEEQLHTTKFQVMPDYSVRLYDYLNEKERIGHILMEHKIVVTDMSSEGESLEDYFISIVGGGKNDQFYTC